MKIIFIILISYVLSFGSLNADEQQNSSVFYQIMKENDLDIELKSYKGWLRVFNNKHKLKRWDLDRYSDIMIKNAIMGIKEIQNTEKLEGNL